MLKHFLKVSVFLVDNDRSSKQCFPTSRLGSDMFCACDGLVVAAASVTEQHCKCLVR